MAENVEENKPDKPANSTVPAPNIETTATPPPPVSTTPTIIASDKTPDRKEFKHYLFEFFMLFLAVFCGFFAEYKLEEVIEHQKEKQYIQSIMRDMSEDTVKINLRLSHNYWLINGLDSLVQFIYSFNPSDPYATRELYRLYVTYGRNEYTVKFTDRTLAPLKNSGNFRIIRSQLVSDSLLRYDEQMKYALDAERSYDEYWSKTLDLSVTIFDYRYLRFNYAQNRMANSLVSLNPVLLNQDPAVLYQYANLLELWKQMIVNYNYSCNYLKQWGVILIPFLQKEYNIKSERR